MPWLQIIMAVFGAVSQMSQASAQKKAAKRQEEAARVQSDLVAKQQEDAARYQEEVVAKRQEAAALESKQIADKNAQSEEASTQETLGKQLKQNAVEEASARAAAAASGFAYTADEDTPSSIALSLASQKTENRRQAEYAEVAGKSRADIIRRQGAQAYTIGLNQAEDTKFQAGATRHQADVTRAQAEITRSEAASSRAKSRASWIGAFGSLFKAGADYWGSTR